MALTPGQRLKGRYTLIERLHKPASSGRALWFARDEQATQALMVVLGEAEGTAGARTELARRLCELQNGSIPGLQKVYDVFETPDTLYYVYERISGMSLAEIIGDQPEPGQVVVWMDKVLETIGQLHNKGLVYTELKPDVIQISHSWRMVTLLDPAGTREPGRIPAQDSEIHFDPRYSAPEQHPSTNTVTREMEVYAAGACLYYALTGVEPPKIEEIKRGSASLNLVLLKAIKSLPRTSQTLDAVVARAMETSPSKRYGRVEDLRADLQPYIAASSSIKKLRQDLKAARDEATQLKGERDMVLATITQVEGERDAARAEARQFKNARKRWHDIARAFRKQRDAAGAVAEQLKGERDAAQAEVSQQTRRANLLRNQRRRYATIVRTLEKQRDAAQAEASQQTYRADLLHHQLKQTLRHPLGWLLFEQRIRVICTLFVLISTMFVVLYDLDAAVVVNIVFSCVVFLLSSIILGELQCLLSFGFQKITANRLSGSLVIVLLSFLLAIVVVQIEFVHLQAIDIFNWRFFVIVLLGCIAALGSLLTF